METSHERKWHDGTSPGNSLETGIRYISFYY
jgi:hypothetical protein